MSSAKASRLYFDERDSDDNDFACRYYAVDERIEFESLDEISFPLDRLDWLIACLTRIKGEIE